jgi:hypothetical protein
VSSRAERSSRCGRALVRIGGNAFEGQATYDGRAVSLLGRLRHEAFVDGARAVRYGPTVERTWPIGKVSVVEWLGEVTV